MSKQEKLFFVLNKIDDAWKITTYGEYVKLHPITDLGLTSQIEFEETASILKKLEADEKIIRIIEESVYHLLDPSTNMPDYYVLEVLERFRVYLAQVRSTRLTKLETKRMIDEIIRTRKLGNKETRFLIFLSDLEPKETEELAKEIHTNDIKHLKGAVSKKIRGTDFRIKTTRGGGYKKSTYQLEYLPFSKSQ